MESFLPDARRARMALLVLAAVGFAWLLTPRIYGPFTDHLHKEDGLIFLSGEQAGESLLTTYTGYLHVGPRLVTQTCAAAPPEAFAACVAGGSAGLRVALMVLVFAVLSPYVRRWGWALGVPGQDVGGTRELEQRRTSGWDVACLRPTSQTQRFSCPTVAPA